MKKKTIILMIMIFFALMLSACSGSGSSVSNDTPEPSADTSVETASSDSNQYVIGNTIKFGSYEWLVLDVRDGKALLLTEEIIAFRFGNISDSAEEALTTLSKEIMSSWGLSDFEGYTTSGPKYDGIYEALQKYASAHPEIFNDDMWYTSWESCSLREWLNREMDFTPNEWKMIETTEVIDKTGLGANTMDKVFLLDKDNVEKYFPRNESRGATCKVSDEELLRFLQHSLLMGTLSGNIAEKALNDGIFCWWVRGSVAGEDFLELMSTDDELYSISPNLKQLVGVRPAIWIRINE